MNKKVFSVSEEKSHALGVLFKERRMEFGYTRGGISRDLGMTANEITRIEEGKVKKINPFHLKAICNKLKLNYIEILNLVGYLDLDEYKELSRDSKMNPVTRVNILSDNLIYKRKRIQVEKDFEDIERDIRRAVAENNFARLTKLSNMRDSLLYKLDVLKDLEEDAKEMKSLLNDHIMVMGQGDQNQEYV